MRISSEAIDGNKGVYEVIMYMVTYVNPNNTRKQTNSFMKKKERTEK